MICLNSVRLSVPSFPNVNAVDASSVRFVPSVPGTTYSVGNAKAATPCKIGQRVDVVDQLSSLEPECSDFQK